MSSRKTLRRLETDFTTAVTHMSREPIYENHSTRLLPGMKKPELPQGLVDQKLRKLASK